MAKRIEVLLIGALNAAEAKAEVDDGISKFLVGESEIVRGGSDELDPETGRELFAWSCADKAQAALVELLNEANVSVRESTAKTAIDDIMVTANAEDGGRVFINPTLRSGKELWNVGPKLQPQNA